VIGVFGVKGGYYQSIAMIPLIVITYFFQSYVQDRFPKFAEVLPVSLAQSVDDVLEQRRAVRPVPVSVVWKDLRRFAPHCRRSLRDVQQTREFMGEPSPHAPSPVDGEHKFEAVHTIHAQPEFEYDHEPLQIIRATIDEDAEPKRVLSEREQSRVASRAYIQPSLIAPNTIRIVQLSEAEKKERAALHADLQSTNLLGGLKELANPDFFRINAKAPSQVDAKEAES
jgi:hypothetical protein